MSSVSASAASGDYIEIQSYDIDMTVQENRKIEVKETITVEFLRAGLTMFYRSLPTDGARYSGISAACKGNDAFEYYVADNPDVDGFIDINCVGNADKGKVWTYELTYTMEQGVDTQKDGMTIDVVGFGWTVPLHNVTAKVHLPERVRTYEAHTDMFGSATQNKVDYALSENGKTVTMSASILNLVYNREYDEYVTGGITLEFALPEGALADYTATRIFTDDMGKILLGGIGAVALAFVVLIFTRKQEELISVVNVKPPEGMDPMKMGKWLDGAVNDEDVTSMIYYFANKGYLRIDMTDENDPELIGCVHALPESASAYEKTLFNGLFKAARQNGAYKAARISECVGKFYDAMQKAKMQVPNPPTMYEVKSILGYLGGAVISVLYALIVCFAMGARLGGDYTYPAGLVFAIPVALIAILGYINENYRYKWKPAMRRGMLIAQVAIAVAFTAINTLLATRFVMTEWEKLALCLGVFGACFMTQGALSRSENYLKILGQILGFKDFIVVTEEDKIKFMLEENPELYYDVLPYAQVLGVTDEWEEKFQKLTIEPPSWYYGSRMTVFDHYIIHRSLNRALAREIAKEASRRSSKGGGRVGRSGGGGSFGGFGGGGFGGGGGGAR